MNPSRTMREAAAALTDAFDDTAPPDRRIHAIGTELERMKQAGELDALPEDTRRRLGVMPMMLLSVAGDVFEMRRKS